MTSNTPEDFQMASLPGSGAAETYSVALGPERIAINGNPLTANESDKTSGKKRKASDVKKDKEIDRDKVREWTDKGGITFDPYPEKKKKALVKASKKRRDERGDDHLDCNMCAETFLEEYQLEDHFDKAEHISKRRDKSESKTAGDLNIFRDFREEMRTHSPRRENPVPEQTLARLHSGDLQSLPGEDDEALDNAFDRFDAEVFSSDGDSNMFHRYDTTLKGQELPIPGYDHTSEEKFNQLKIPITKDFTELKTPEELEDLIPQEKFIELQAELKQYIVGLKKNETKGDSKVGQFKYEFGRREYYRMMSVLEDCSSVLELAKNLVLCGLKIKRGKYDKSHHARAQDT